MLFLVIILVITNFDRTFALCNVCGVNSKSVCLSRNSYQICNGDKIINELGIFYCPNGWVCVDDSYRCLPEEIATPSCGGDCEICDPQTHVACVNEETFAFCFEENAGPSRIYGFCEQGKVCNAKSPIICVDEDSMEPTCPDYSRTTTTTPATTTTSSTTDSPIPTLAPKPFNPDDFCQRKKKFGKYSIPGKCHSYIICMMSGIFWIGREYNCYHEGVFDCKLRLCTVNGDCDYSCSS